MFRRFRIVASWTLLTLKESNVVHTIYVHNVMYVREAMTVISSCYVSWKKSFIPGLILSVSSLWVLH